MITLKIEYKEDNDDRIENISELANVFKNLEAGGKSFWNLWKIICFSSEQDRIGSDKSVKIMTLHAAKGLEFPVVFIPALEEGISPSLKSLDNLFRPRGRTEAVLCRVYAGKREALSFVRCVKNEVREHFIHAEVRYLNEIKETIKN